MWTNYMTILHVVLCWPRSNSIFRDGSKLLLLRGKDKWRFYSHTCWCKKWGWERNSSTNKFIKILPLAHFLLQQYHPLWFACCPVLLHLVYWCLPILQKHFDQITGLQHYNTWQLICHWLFDYHAGPLKTHQKYKINWCQLRGLTKIKIMSPNTREKP